MPICIRIIAFVILAAAFDATQATSQNIKAANPQNEPAAWSAFLWEKAKIGGREYSRVALLIPVRLPKQQRVAHMQLDLGASSVFNAAAYSRFLRLPRSSKPPDVFSGTIAEHETRDLPVRLLDTTAGTAKGGNGDIIGTLGMDFFASHSLVIDFPGQRILILDYQEPPERHVSAAMTFSEAFYRNDKYFVSVSIAGTPYKDGFFFDTGSSLFPLITHQTLWRILTGHTGTEPANARMDINSWGKKVTVIGAPMKESIEIAGAVFPNPVVFYAPNGEFDFPKFDPRIIGLFGNALFYNRVVIVDPYRKRFGISK